MRLLQITLEKASGNTLPPLRLLAADQRGQEKKLLGRRPPQLPQCRLGDK
jgi:hypothetical protein